MSDLFYSETDKTLFYIAGYTDNSSKVEEMIKMLDEGAKKLKKFSSLDKEVFTTFVTSSRRYKEMRVFYFKNVEPSEVSKKAFKIGKDWNMFKWLEN